MNGWKNWETWNVALWIQNEEVFYREARLCSDYQSFVDRNEDLIGAATPDGAKWNDASLDIAALDEMIGEL